MNDDNTPKEYKYIRVSSKSQNVARQLDENYIQFIDVCSGTIPFLQRPNASELFDLLNEYDVLAVDSVDRLGRNKMDIINTLDQLKQKKVIVQIEDLGIASFTRLKESDEWKFNYVFDIITSLLSSMAEYSRVQIKDRTAQGIAIAKIEGKYEDRITRKPISDEKFKELNKMHFKKAKANIKMSSRDLGNLLKVSKNKALKIKKMIEESK